MDTRLTTLERAYQLARSGDYSGVSEIKAQLRTEGFTDAATQIYGPTLIAHLRRLCLAARSAAPPTD